MIDVALGQTRLADYLVESIRECAAYQKCHLHVLLSKLAYSIQVMCAHIRHYSKSHDVVQELQQVCGIARESNLSIDDQIIAVYWRPKDSACITMYESGFVEPAYWYTHGDNGFVIAHFENNRCKEIDVLNVCLSNDGSFEKFEPPPVPKKANLNKRPAARRVAKKPAKRKPSKKDPSEDASLDDPGNSENDAAEDDDD